MLIGAQIPKCMQLVKFPQKVNAPQCLHPNTRNASLNEDISTGAIPIKPLVF